MEIVYILFLKPNNIIYLAVIIISIIMTNQEFRSEILTTI